MTKGKRRNRHKILKQKWVLFYANARGISSKKTSIIEIMGELNPQIALFAETMLNTQNGFSIEGYTFCGKSRPKKACGGVGILVKNEFKHLITPHETAGDIELIWVSIKRKEKKPIYVGVYYGKQETRTRNDMLEEMDILSREIHDKKNEGEVILFMDGNGKIGLLGEDVSRNGEMLMQVFNECELEIMNKSEKCEGAVTRVNRSKTSERSAIDFVLASEYIEEKIERIIIDENCDFALKGVSLTDHNSFIMNLDIENGTPEQCGKVTKWRLNAPVEKWNSFENVLRQNSGVCKDIMEQDDVDINVKYRNWKSFVERQALETIGKTTYRPNGKPKESTLIRTLRVEKREAKKEFQNEVDPTNKAIRRDEYIGKQVELRNQIQFELEEQMELKFRRMIENGMTGFWKLMKITTRDEFSNWVCLKDENGKRVLDPEQQKEIAAKYYEGLFSPDESLQTHPYHEQVMIRISEYSVNYDYETEWYNRLPSKKAVEDAISSKKNGKATTDFPNEMIKRGGEGFVECFYPVFQQFWNNEVSIREFNEGIITSLFKGKGDREMMKFQRGITVSSTISMIFEELINERMQKLMPLTQAQGGGKKGTSTRDHVFLLRGAITHSLKYRKKMFITFYDVAKAYDRANVEDMLVIAWEHGVKGKLWRLMKILNTNLSARIKLRHGLTREIQRKAGGKQGGKNFGFLFAKMMDVLAEEAADDDMRTVKFGSLDMSVLEWVDDVITFAIEEAQQEYTLGKVNEFAVKHRLKWGKEKCNVMEVGKGKYEPKKWPLGEEEIDSCEQYRYLGDIIMRDGGNKKNIEDRENKVMASTRKIMASCGNGVFKKIQLKALLKMHNTCTIAGYLTNCETWVLNKGEREKLERIELWALKNILHVPKTTPTPAIWYITGSLTTSILIDKRQLLYLKTILDRPDGDSTRKMLNSLDDDDIGWPNQIRKTLEHYELVFSWDQIKTMKFTAWKKLVTIATEKKNKEKLIEMCYDVKGEKRKTKFILERLQAENYVRSPRMDILCKSRLRARIQIMSMFGMLDCAKNYKHGYKGDLCSVCGTTDDENHRINYCPKFIKTNLCNSLVKFDFSSMYSINQETVDRAIDVVSCLWILENGKNEMRVE